MRKYSPEPTVKTTRYVRENGKIRPGTVLNDLFFAARYRITLFVRLTTRFSKQKSASSKQTSNLYDYGAMWFKRHLTTCSSCLITFLRFVKSKLAREQS